MEQNAEMIAGYKIIRALDKKRGSSILEAEKDGKKYALKVLFNPDQDSILRFRREFSSLARLSHPNLMKIYDVGEFEKSMYMAMEFIEGVTLENWRSDSQHTHLGAENLITITAEALQELHRNNLIHRDIKPANVMITNAGEVRLIDLGLVIDVNAAKKETGLAGTALYCSPEQSKILHRDTDFRSDLYSLGATYFYLLTGRPPFVGTAAEIFQAHASKVAPNPQDFNKDVRSGASAIVGKLLAKDPDDRYQTIEGLIYDLKRIEKIDQEVASGRKPKLGIADHSEIANIVSYVPRPEISNRVHKAWMSAQSKFPQLHILTGSPGFGKTRFCKEFCRSIVSEKSDLLILEALCTKSDQSTPFHAISSMMKSWSSKLSLHEEAAQRIARDNISRAAIGYEQEVASVFPFFSDLLNVTRKESNSLQVDGERELFFSNITDFICTLVGLSSSAIIVVDEIHWIDQASLQILNLVLKRKEFGRLLLLATIEDEFGSDTLLKAFSNRLEDVKFESTEIGELNKSQLQRLISAYLGSESVAPAVSAAIQKLSNGNALVALDILRASQEQGFIYFTNNSWKFDQENFEKISLAKDVTELIVRRLKNLNSSEEISFFQTAALCGEFFDIEEIATVEGIDRTKAQSLVASAQTFGLVERASVTRLRFVHERIPGALIAQMDAADKMEKSDRLAKFFYEKTTKTSEEKFAAARLFRDNPSTRFLDIAIEANIEAAVLAYNNFAYDEAYVFYKFAFERMRSTTQLEDPRVRISQRLAVCATMLDDENLAYECADITIKNSKDTKSRLEAHALCAWIYGSFSEYVNSWEHFKSACRVISRPFPLYLHQKLLEAIRLWLLSIILELLPAKLCSLFSFNSKSHLSGVSSLYRDAQVVSEGRGNILENFIVSLRLLLVGLVSGNNRERSIGYAGIGYFYGTLGLKPLCEVYSSKARNSSELLGDSTTSTYCLLKELAGKAYCGIIQDFAKEYEANQEKFHRYLSRFEMSRAITQLGYFYAFRGLHNESLKLSMKTLDSCEKGIFRLNKAAIVSHLNQSWYQLAAIGKSKESQKIKKTALEKNNNLRLSPVVARSAMTAEICLRRISHEANQETDEIINAWWKRGGRQFVDPLANNVASLLTFLRLYKYQNSREVNERFSARHEICVMLTKLSTMLFCPLFRANYYFLRGSLHRTEGRLKRAEKAFNRAEKLATDSNGYRILFDILVERARIQKQLGNVEYMRYLLSSALHLASKHEWVPSVDLLKIEFGADYETVVQEVGLIPFGSGSEQFGSSSGTGANATIYQTQYASRTVVQETIAGSFQLEDRRLIDALLNVSNAFVTSIDPIAQARAVLSEVVKLFAAERGFIFEFNENTKNLDMIAGVTSDGVAIASLSGYSRTVVEAARKKSVLYAGNNDKEAIVAESAIQYGLRSIMATPLTTKDELIGIVYLDSTLTKGLFSEKDVELFVTLASQIAIAFQLSRIARYEVERVNMRRELEMQKAVSIESKKVAVLVDNMRQAVFAVDREGIIREPVSKFSETVFESKVADQSIFDILYNSVTCTAEEISGVQAVVSTTFGEDSIQWDLLEDKLPRRLVFPAPSSGEKSKEKKVLKILPSPIWNDDSLLEKVLIVAEDVTLLEKMEERAKSQAERSDILTSLLEVDYDLNARFFEQASGVLTRVRSELKTPSGLNLPQLLRDLHTLKGNARLNKLTGISLQIHHSESNLADLGATGIKQEEIATKVDEELNAISAALTKYSKVFDEVFKMNKSSGGEPSISSMAMTNLNKAIEEVASQITSQQAETLKAACEKLKWVEVASTMSRFRSMISELCSQLGKDAEYFINGNALLDRERLEQLQECLLHLIRNSLDHGLEAPEERVRSGKDSKGRISIECSENEKDVIIMVSDDGRGIDHERILKSGIAKGLVTAEEAKKMDENQIRNLIFAPGFSTKDSATDVSGRGVGLDVVKTNLEKINADLELKSKVGKGSSFIMRIPVAPSQSAQKSESKPIL